MTERPPVTGTARVLTAGVALSAALLVLGFVLGIAGVDAASAMISTAGVLVLLATPAVSLVVTAVELRPLQPRAALLALGVLAILAMAVVLALATR